MLQEQDRIKLDKIVSQMTANKESDANIQFVVNDFKKKYSTQTPTPTQPQGYLSTTGADIKAIGGDIAKRFETARAGVEKAQQGKQGVASAMLQTTGQIAGGIGDIAYRGVKAIAPEFVEQGVKKTLGAVATGYGMLPKEITDLGKEAVFAYKKLKETHPEVVANLEASGNILSILPIGKGAQITGKVVGEIPEIIEAVAKKTTTVAKQLPSKAEQTLVANLNETFKKGTIGVKNISDYAESRGVNLGQEIVSRKIKPIVENDRLKFGTEPFKILDNEIDSDSKIIDEAIKQYPNTRIPAYDVKIGVALQIAKDPLAVRQGAVAGMTEEALKKIDDFIEQTGRTDFSLEEIQSFKKGMWEASKKFKIAETGKSDAYSELGKYFKGVIETEVPDVKIQEINAKIGRAQETYKMLDKINSLQDGGIVLKGGKIGRYTTDVIGAGVGGALGSAGGPIGGAIGAATGYKISSLIRGLSQKSAILGPIDRILIKFAKDVPENTAIKEAKTFIDAVKAGKKPTITPRVQKTIEKAWAAKEKVLPMDTPIEMEMGTYKLTKNKTTGRVEMKFKPKSQSSLDKSTQTSAKASAKAISKTVPQTTTKSNLHTEARKYKTAEEFVGAQGKPVYHGSSRSFKNFDVTKLGEATKSRSAKAGFFFTDDLGTAKSYATAENWKKVQDFIDAGDMKSATKLENQIFAKQDPSNVINAYIKFKKPLTIDADGATYSDFSNNIEDAIAKAKVSGNDGLIIKNLSDNADYSEYTPATHYLVLDSSLIKTRSQLTDIWKKAHKK